MFESRLRSALSLAGGRFGFFRIFRKQLFTVSIRGQNHLGSVVRHCGIVTKLETTTFVNGLCV